MSAREPWTSAHGEPGQSAAEGGAGGRGGRGATVFDGKAEVEGAVLEGGEYTLHRDFDRVVVLVPVHLNGYRLSEVVMLLEGAALA